VLVPTRGRRSQHGIRLHTTRTLHPDDIAAVRGLPVTSVARTLVDFAATERPEVTERVVHQAEVERVLDVRAVEAAIDRIPNRRRAAYLRTIISTPSPGPTHLGLEEDFLALCRRHGIPAPTLNAWVRTAEQHYEVDAFWPAHGLVVELDGAAVHHTRRAFEEDRRRDAALTTEGYAVMRFTHDRVTNDAAAVARQLRTRTSRCERPWR
jgi:transposase-like protein